MARARIIREFFHSKHIIDTTPVMTIIRAQTFILRVKEVTKGQKTHLIQEEIIIREIRTLIGEMSQLKVKLLIILVRDSQCQIFKLSPLRGT